MSEQRLSHLDGAIQLWSQLAEGLRQGGYAHAAPEYLRFSRMLHQARLDELEAGGGEEEVKWQAVRQLASTAHDCLHPLVEAARIISELPDGPAAAPEQGTTLPGGPSEKAEEPREAVAATAKTARKAKGPANQKTTRAVASRSAAATAGKAARKAKKRAAPAEPKRPPKP